MLEELVRVPPFHFFLFGREGGRRGGEGCGEERAEGLEELEESVPVHDRPHTKKARDT